MIEALASIVVSGLIFAWVKPWRPPAKSPLKDPDVIPFDFTFNPTIEQLKVLEETGDADHFLVRDVERDLLDQRILELESENAQLRAMQVQVEAMSAQSEIPFKPNEPQRLEEYHGQPHVTIPLSKAILALPAGRRVIDHKLFTGLPGLGKTLIAKVIANELALRAATYHLRPVRFFWSFAANINTAALLDKFARDVLAAGGGVWFIDEIHVLDEELATKIYSLMEDGVYPFEGDLNPTPIPDLMVVGATTDYGGLHPALKRRFGEPLMLRRMEREAIVDIITKRDFPIQEGAAELLADRTHWSGAPWEALVLRREAEIYATSAGRTLITEEDVTDVFATYEIDDFGLRWQDRQVLKALFSRPRLRGKNQEFVCFAASEQDVSGLASLDLEEYRETIKPRLMARGLLEVRSGYGQALTDHAVSRYGFLKT